MPENAMPVASERTERHTSGLREGRGGANFDDSKGLGRSRVEPRAIGEQPGHNSGLAQSAAAKTSGIS